MSEPRDPAPPPNPNEERNELLEDALGVSLGILRVLVDAFARPKRLLLAVLARDRSYYASPLRAWLAVVGAQFVIMFFSGGLTGLLRRQDQGGGGGLTAAIESQGKDPERVFAVVDSIYSFALIPTVAAFQIPAIFLLLAFARDRFVPFARHMQAHFGFLCASSLIALAIGWFGFRYQAVAWAQLALSWAVLTVNFARAAPGVYAHGPIGAALKGVAYSTAIVILAALGSTALVIGAMIYGLTQG